MFMFWYRYIYFWLKSIPSNRFKYIKTTVLSEKQVTIPFRKWNPNTSELWTWVMALRSWWILSSQVPATKPPLLEMMKEFGRLRHHRAAALRIKGCLIHAMQFLECHLVSLHRFRWWNPILWWKNIFDIAWITVFPGFYNVVVIDS